MESDFVWTQITEDRFLELKQGKHRLVCSCHVYFYFGEGKCPQLKMNRVNTSYYAEYNMLQELTTG